MTKKQLLEEIDDLESRLSEWKEKYEDLKGVRDEADKARDEMRIMRDERNHMESEVEWFRHVLEMMFIPADKLAELGKMREERRMGGRY